MLLAPESPPKLPSHELKVATMRLGRVLMIVHVALVNPALTVVVTAPPVAAEEVICTLSVSPGLAETDASHDPVPLTRTSAPPVALAVTVPPNPLNTALVV